MIKKIRNVKIETNYLGNEEYFYGTATKTVDVTIKDGKVSAVSDASESPLASDEIEGAHQLLLPGIREMHCHFDKSKLGVPWQPIKPAKTIIERFTEELQDLESLKVPFQERMENFLALEIPQGVTFFRSHIDVHPKIGQKYLQETLTVLEKYQNYFGYELVAFPQHGLLLSQAFTEMKTALQNGAAIVGGVDPASLDGDVEKSLNQTFELAKMFDAPIDLHIHDRQQAARQTFYQLLALTKEMKWQNRVTISHGFGLSDFDEVERKELYSELAQNGISVFSSVPLDGSLPPLEELRQAGVNVALGCDNVYDSWSPFGDGNLLEKLNRYNEIFQLTSQKALTDSLNLVTGKNILSGKPWLAVGMPADFILTKAGSTAEFVARKVPIEKSFYQGKVVYQKNSRRFIFLKE